MDKYKHVVKDLKASSMQSFWLDDRHGQKQRRRVSVQDDFA